MTPKVYEIWRVKYKNQAYVDQTGLSHYGTVVYEQLIVTETGREPQYEYYAQKWYPDSIILAVSEDGRSFRGTPNLVDFHGRTRWEEIEEEIKDDKYIKNPDYGHWEGARACTIGCCYPDGTGPVKSILKDGEKK